MKRLLVPAAVAVLMAGFAFWWFSPEQVLKRRTRSLLETLTMDAGTGLSSRQMGVYSLNALLAPEVQLDTPTIEQANGTFERQDLESAFSWLCRQAKQTRFELERIDSITVSGGTGEVACVLEAVVELPTYRPADGLYQVRFFWRRGEDGWRLERAMWAEAAR
ncbi:MAG: hypothetical protein EHM17_08855 [Verrucomicrobiaceae bacterium]|nr:MAG: hypothetical protein EHM17_08855 [Verrucomicrobiaceae bacterium]